MSIADAIRTSAATWPKGERAWNESVERDVVRAFLMPHDAQGSVTDSQTFMLLVAEALDDRDQRERLETARAHAAQQASQWAMEARGHRSTVLEILRYFGLPAHDWEALSLIRAKVPPWRGLVARRPAMTRFCKGVRAGDEWVFDTNTGGISRIIVGFDDERVYYRSYGEHYEQSCTHATFNRWLKGARLEYRKVHDAGVAASENTSPKE